MVVPIPQIRKIFKDGTTKGIALGTYSLLCVTVLLYLIHAIQIGDLVFTITNAVGICFNGFILIAIINERYIND